MTERRRPEKEGTDRQDNRADAGREPKVGHRSEESGDEKLREGASGQSTGAEGQGADLVQPGESTALEEGEVFEPSRGEPEQLAPEEALKKRLEAKEAEANEYLQTLQRVQADLENFRKRMLKEQTQFLEFAAQNLILQLVPVLDNLDRAVVSAKNGDGLEKLAEGVELIRNQLNSILQNEGLEVLEPKPGEPFDPLHQEAVMQVETEDHPEHAVVELLQKGYSLKGRVLRPAMVKVAKK